MQDLTDQFYIAIESLNAKKEESFRMEYDIYVRKSLLIFVKKYPIVMYNDFREYISTL